MKVIYNKSKTRITKLTLRSDESQELKTCKLNSNDQIRNNAR